MRDQEADARPAPDDDLPHLEDVLVLDPQPLCGRRDGDESILHEMPENAVPGSAT
jgi:hypothetical protein